VPHTAVDLIVVNGQSVGFDYQLQTGDHAAVYPVFETPDIFALVRLREKTLPYVNLGKLAKRMRLLGFDSLYRNDYRDAPFRPIRLVHPFARCLICNGLLTPVAKADI